ncbi:MAG: ROK family protein [Bacteroidetes bacterium]|nr:MAG: ROK family protein [Bacteroidota bacterium]
MQVLGVDIGGSGIKGAIVDTQTGELITERFRIETPQPATPDAIANTVNELVKHFAWKGKIGCGFPAVIHDGIAKTAANVDSTWININVDELFTKKTGLETYVVNDADAAGIAEMKFGIGKDKKGVVLLLTIGTGIGSALFMNGKLIPNTEYGHLYYKGDVAEKYCSDSIRKKLDLKWDEWAKRFSNFLKHIERTINPDLIIVGGGVSKKQEKFFHLVNIETELRLALLENNAGIVGAAINVVK